MAQLRRSSTSRHDLMAIRRSSNVGSGAPIVLGIKARRKGPLRVITRITSRWLIIFAIVASIYSVLLHYSSLDVMPRVEKHQFNAIITGLSIALGLMMESCLSSMVADLRWWILSRRYRSRHKIDLILQADSMPHLIIMALKTRRGTIHLAVIVWAVILLAAQVAVASLGLCYSTDTADQHALMIPGQIYAPDLTELQAGGLVSVKTVNLGAQQYTANSYGIISTAYIEGDDFSEVPPAGTLVQPTDPVIFCPSSCRYVFKEISVRSVTNNDLSPVTVTTSRSIDSSTQCESRRVTAGGDGNGTRITVAGVEGDFQVDLPMVVGTNISIFMADASKGCGEGCSQLTVFEASNESPWYYTCNATVHQVANASRPEHYASAQIRSMAAAAIALQGYSAFSFDTNAEEQSQTYPSESIFGAPANGSAEEMAALISRFSIGVISVVSQNNKMLIIDGIAPQRGIVLKITHPGIVLAILGIILGVVLCMEIALAIWAHRVVVPRDGPFIMSQILKPMTNHPYYQNSTRYDSTFMTLGKPSSLKSGEPLWKYSCTLSEQDGFYDLHMEEFKKNSEPGEIKPARSEGRDGSDNIELGTVQASVTDNSTVP